MRAIPLITVLVLLVASGGETQAGLILTIENYTADELSFSISGSFDSDTIGESPGYLALKNDWSHNVGIHTELFSTAPTVFSNTILIGGVALAPIVQDGADPWKDNVFFQQPAGLPFFAGTTVSGSMTLRAIGAFNPANASALELVSGFNRPVGHQDWARLEYRAPSSAVPEPTSLVVFGIGASLLGIVRRSRRTSNSSAMG